MDGQSITLHRACKNCVKSKRRCNLVLPQCSRCTNRGLICEYANAPAPIATTTGPSLQREPRVGKTAKNQPHRVIYRPLRMEILKTHDAVIVQYLISAMRDVPVTFAKNMQTTFIHPQLYGSSCPGAIRDMFTICRWQQRSTGVRSNILLSSQLRQKSAELYRLAKAAATIEELLAYTQSLIIAQCLLLFHCDKTQNTKNEESDDYVDFTTGMVTGLAQYIWQKAPVHVPHILSPWRAWLLAESIRRTIIIAHIVCSTFSFKQRSYSVRTPFIEALPFDLRSSLWDASSEEVWQQQASQEPVEMVSLREYSDMLVSGRASTISKFGSVVLAACKGVSVSSIYGNEEEHWNAMSDTSPHNKLISEEYWQTSL